MASKTAAKEYPHEAHVRNVMSVVTSSFAAEVVTEWAIVYIVILLALFAYNIDMEDSDARETAFKYHWVSPDAYRIMLAVGTGVYGLVLAFGVFLFTHQKKYYLFDFGGRTFLFGHLTAIVVLIMWNVKAWYSDALPWHVIVIVAGSMAMAYFATNAAWPFTQHAHKLFGIRSPSDEATA